jgi:ferredoxin-type protein NapF
MSAAISRMQFLRGDFSGNAAPLRPPWARSENEFTRLCVRCGDCISQCPNHIIVNGRGDFPVVDFSAGECLFCAECVDACKPGALKKSDGQQAWSVRATIDSTKCLAYHNVECRSCYDPCEAQAIRMAPRIGGVSIPVLDNPACSGCGACYGICPVHAINMQSNPQQVSP